VKYISLQTSVGHGCDAALVMTVIVLTNKSFSARVRSRMRGRS
jgi:hypothetical protein